jgi:glycosyltransferase involved in cell wall biosynthesis
MPPIISVLLPVRNGAAFLEECLNSVLSQTFKDFECILVNDGSVDETAEILQKVTDPRVQSFELNPGVGVPAALNFAVERSQGKYLARVDADDVLDLKRFERQVEFMESNPDVGVLGCWAEHFGAKGALIARPPACHGAIVSGLFFRGTMLHPTVMIRRSALGGERYNSNCRYAEDIDLWLRLLHRTQFRNLQELLVRHRMHRGMATFRNNQKMEHLMFRLREQLVAEFIPDLELQRRIVSEHEQLLRYEKVSYGQWLLWFRNLKKAAKNSILWTQEQIDHILKDWQRDSLRRVYFLKKRYTPNLFWKYLTDSAKPWRVVSFRKTAVFGLKCLICWRAKPFV